MNFWEKLKKPIIALAPLSGITDSPFRQICRSLGADVVYSELASTTAMVYNAKVGLERIRFDAIERPYVAQLFGSNPEHFAVAARLVTQEIRPDGIDINFGCPAPKVIKQGAGAALMPNLPLSREIIKNVIDNTDLPVSIKVRIRAKGVLLVEFLNYISDLNVKAIMIHGRTLKQGFNGQVDFEAIKETRNHFNGIILANGGVKCAEDGIDLLEKTEADGIGIARGALGRPWIFREFKNRYNNNGTEEMNTNDIIKIAIKHAELMNNAVPVSRYVEMRKHLVRYVKGFPDAGKLKDRLVKINDFNDVLEIFGGTV